MTLHTRRTPKQVSLALACTAALTCIVLPVQGEAATANASSSGTVVTPIAITKSADLDFGSFAAGTGGTITISTSGARTVSGVVPISSSTTSAAKFDVTGETGATYAITIPATVTLTSGSDTMTLTPVNDLTAGNATSGTVTTGTLTGGAESIYVGGSLAVGASQAPGSYTGSVSVAVEYN